MQNAIVVSCDDAYAMAYLPPLCASAHLYKQRLHARIINASDESHVLFRMVERLDPNITFDFVDRKLDHYGDIQKKVIYAAERYDAAAEFIYAYKCGVLVLDVDSYINRPIDWSWATKPLGIWDRRDENLGNNDIEKAGMKVIACCYSDNEHFFDLVYSKIHMQKFGYWFLDQVAVYEAWQESQLDHVQLRGLGIIDWEFDDQTMIHTGKGNRKFTNSKYIERCDEFREVFNKWCR